MSAATLQGQATRKRLLRAALLLLRRSGLSGAGINEIVRESQAPKGSVYHFFPQGKHQIVAEALTGYTAGVTAFIDAALATRRAPGAKVRALFDAFAERIEKGEFRASCPAGTVCLDLDETTEGLREVVAAAFEAYAGAIEKHFPSRSPKRSREFARLLVTAIEGAYIRGRAQRSGQPFREAGAWLATAADQAFAGR